MLFWVDLSKDIILTYPLTEFVEHIINLTVLQALFGRWPGLIRGKVHIIACMYAGWLTSSNAARLFCKQQLCCLLSSMDEFHEKRVQHSLIELRFDILHCFLSFAENLTVGIVHPSQNIATLKKKNEACWILWLFLLLSSTFKLISRDGRKGLLHSESTAVVWLLITRMDK